MNDAVLRLPNGDLAAEGAVCELPAAGLVLQLGVPPGAGLAEAVLQVAAAPSTAGPREFTDAVLISDLGEFPAGGEAVAWLRATLPQERTVTGVSLRGAPGGAARVRVFSRDGWRPLAAPDTLALAAEARRSPVPLTAFAASAVMVELLAPFKPTAEAPAIFLPAPQKVAGLTLFGSDQPCHLAAAVGADPPFFTRDGPLPPQPTAIEGLFRAMARFRSEHPDAAAIPLRITAAGPTRILLAGMRFSIRPAQAEEHVTPVGPPTETFFPPNVQPQAKKAQLCDATHWVAQRVDAPRGGEAIASLGLWLRAGADPVRGGVALHGGADEPDPDPLPGLEEAPLAVEAADQPGWATCRPAVPWRTDRPAWVVCRLTAGEALWFTGDAGPPGLGRTLARTGGGGWARSEAAGEKGWAQLRLGLVPRDA